MKPIEAKTHDDICKLKRDNIETVSGFGLLLSDEDHISIHQPKGGRYIELPRRDFEEMIARYVRGVVPAGDARTESGEQE